MTVNTHNRTGRTGKSAPQVKRHETGGVRVVYPNRTPAAIERGRQQAAQRSESLNHSLELIVKRLVDQFDPDQIILFGSHARGTARPDSDIDLLVVLPLTGSRRAKQVQMRVALHDIPVPKDIIVATPQQVNRQRAVAGTIIRPALAEGKVLYARR